MSLEWDILSWKEKKAIKLALKNNEGRISMGLLDDIFSSKSPRAKMKKFKKNDLIRPINIGNKYEVNEDLVPQEVVDDVKL